MAGADLRSLMRLGFLGLAALIVLIGEAASPSAAHGRAGDLDASFGSRGRVATRLPRGATFSGLERRHDGRLLAFVTNKTQIVRYRRNGELDSGFGTGGKLTLAGVAGQDLLLRPGGSLAVAARTDLRGYRPGGSPDPSFGGGQPVPLPLDARLLGGMDGGALVVAGYPRPDGQFDGRIALARYRPDGSHDESFGGGLVVADLGEGYAAVQEVIVEPDGKVVVSATLTAETRLDPEPIVLLRFRADGSPDPSFGGDGRVDLPIEFSTAAPMARLPDGRLVVAGDDADNRAFVFRVRPSGALDRSFGRGGKAALRARPGTQQLDAPLAVALARDGRIYVGGVGPRPDDDFYDVFVVTRLTGRGLPDRGFGRRGTVSTAFKTGSGGDRLEALLVEPNGRLIAAGDTGIGLALARYRTGP